MTPKRAAIIQSIEAKKNNGIVNTDSFAARAQKAAAEHVNGRLVTIEKGK